MRTLMVATLLLSAMAASLSPQSDSQDPYGINLVSTELKMNENGQRVINSWSEKNLARLGDRVSIAILKILEPRELQDPEKVKTCLLVIREAFAQPQFISPETDKQPKVTLFLIEYWKQNVHDSSVEADIRKTVEILDENVRK
ncbi:MAG: hypothetical protein WAK20_18245 [Candidatus Acidiferrum sp.]